METNENEKMKMKHIEVVRLKKPTKNCYCLNLHGLGHFIRNSSAVFAIHNTLVCLENYRGIPSATEVFRVCLGKTISLFTAHYQITVGKLSVNDL